MRDEGNRGKPFSPDRREQEGGQESQRGENFFILLFFLIAESRREEKSPKEVKTKLQVCLKDELALYFNIFIF